MAGWDCVLFNTITSDEEKVYFCAINENRVKMYKHLIIGIIGVLSLTLLSCQRESIKITGDYSYKLSGEVAITGEDGEVTYHLIHRNGQMNILKDKSQKGKYIITMNEMNGGCYTIMAGIEDDNVTLDPHTFSTNILSSSGLPDIDPDINFNDDDISSGVYRITASGNGVRNGEMLILREQWNGYQSGNQLVRLNGMEMNIIAEKN